MHVTPAPQPTQLGLLDRVERLERPRKQVRKVSRQQYAVLRDTDVLTARQHQTLTALAHYYYVVAEWPTPAELTRFMFTRGTIARESVNIVAPRISDLVNGEWVWRGEKPHRERVQVGGGTCEYLPVRVCTVTQGKAHPVRIVEAGAVLDRYGYGGRQSR